MTPESGSQRSTPATDSPALEVVSPGIQSLIQDLGRPGLAHLGIARSGAYDRQGLIRANQTLANPPGSPAIEFLLGGLRLLALTDITVCVFLPTTRENTVHFLEQGEDLKVPRLRHGLRGYVSIPGGVAVPLTLGSASTDMMSGLGPRPLASGDRIWSGSSPTAATRRRASSTTGLEGTTGLKGTAGRDGSDEVGSPTEIEVYPGPQAQLVEGGLPRALARTDWVVSQHADRLGVRLTGGQLQVRGAHGLPSQPVMPGTVQAPPGGELVVLGPDGPTTGGYPVVAVINSADLDRFAQFRPGQVLRLTVRDRTAVSS